LDLGGARNYIRTSELVDLLREVGIVGVQSGELRAPITHRRSHGGKELTALS
jgi:hypothetical protein